MENQGCRPLMEECRAGHPAGCHNEGATSARAQLSYVRGLTAAQAYPCRSSSPLTYAVKVQLLLGRHFIPGNWPGRPQISKPDYRPSNTILDAEFPDLLCSDNLILLWYEYVIVLTTKELNLCFDILFSPFILFQAPQLLRPQRSLHCLR